MTLIEKAILILLVVCGSTAIAAIILLLSFLLQIK